MHETLRNPRPQPDPPALQLGAAAALYLLWLVSWLVRHAEDIPIDLATRRVILYGQSPDTWQDDLAVKATRAVKDILRLYQLSAAEAQPAEPGFHVVTTSS